MKTVTITGIEVEDRRFPLDGGAGSDAVHTAGEYAFAVTRLKTDGPLEGCGIALTLGRGNSLVCEAIEQSGSALLNQEIEALMADFGTASRRLADDPALRWLGPHKGVVHLALASVVNACFDLWAKSRGVPLWRLLLDLDPDQVVALLDLSYVGDELSEGDARAILCDHHAGRAQRQHILQRGYPGYDTSVGWFRYEDSQVRERARAAIANGFRALKLKVGADDACRDLRRAAMLREIAGPGCRIMFDANQQWSLCEAERMCRALGEFDPYWVEEPTHPDDVEAHRQLAQSIAPVRIALGEHVPNRVVFKNFMQAMALHFVQADCTRLAGVAEFLTVSLLARKFGLPVVPHVGDMGQIHQHLVLFNHIALGHEVVFLEHIPHLRDRFVHPAHIRDGLYEIPQAPGISCDLIEERAK
jgi:L-fuconate dehydratase